jgi:hypothetical protein
VAIEPSDLLIPTSALSSSGLTPSGIRAEVRLGRLHRVRRGWYVDGATWHDLDDRQQHVVLAAAATASSSRLVLCGLTAAAVWGIPIVETWPAELRVLDAYRGGGRSEPGVRRTSTAADGAPTASHHGLTVTTLSRTVVDLAASHGFVSGVVAADWALAAGVGRDELERDLGRRSSPIGRARARAAIEAADARSESPGESAARAAMIAAGFDAPELQRVFRDDLGEMRVDFFWPEVNVAGEFDGKGKYTRDEFARGDPGEVAWREKRREDRLRRLVDGVVRIVWSDVRRPGAMRLLLADAGVPGGGNMRRAGGAATARRTVIQLDAPARLGPGRGAGAR